LLAFFNASVAVTVFFVISGFVLGLSLDRRDPRLEYRYFPFLIARTFRLYPALIICLVFIGIYWIVLPSPVDIQNTSEWYRRYIPTLDIGIWLKEAALLGCTLNPVAWTLQVEMAAALVLPFMHLASRNRRLAADGMALAVLLFVGWALKDNLVAPQLFVFYLGLMVPATGRRMIENVGDKTLYSFLIGTSLAMMLLPLTFAGEIRYSNRIIEASGAFIFISAMLYGRNLPVFSLLDSRIARFYGKISYSFYLYHFFLMFVLSQLIFAKVPPNLTMAYPLPMGLMLAALSVLISTGVASLSYRFVEHPGITLGKRFSRTVVGLMRTAPRMG